MTAVRSSRSARTSAGPAIALPLADYAAWFKGLGAAGGNWARLWLAYNEKGLEWMPAPTPKPGTGTFLGLGRYSPGNAWRLDEVVRLARENGVYLMFCLGTYGEFTEGGYFNEGCWVSNPYNAKNGGPCARPADFWTSPEARRIYQKRLRYLIARWGYSPNRVRLGVLERGAGNARDRGLGGGDGRIPEEPRSRTVTW